MAKPERRDDALSVEKIVDAAIELLDREGENGLTFRALATRLSTGAGAIYWHVANKNELLVGATDAVVARALAEVPVGSAPRKAIRKIAVGLFEAIDAHPWVGTQLSRGPWSTGTLQIFERIGRQLELLRVPSSAQFTAASTLVSYIVGVSAQNAANGRVLAPDVDREAFLKAQSTRWKNLDADEFRFTRSVAEQMRKHDDRAEFLAGIDLIVAGITAAL